MSKTKLRVAVQTLVLPLALMSAMGVSAADENAPQQGAYAHARLGQINGIYGLTTLQNCVRTPFLPPQSQGIDPVTRKLLIDGEAAVAVGSGTMQFLRDGRVLTSVLGSELAQSGLVAGVAPSSTGIRYQCTGTYKVKPDQSITVDFPSCTVSAANPNVVVTVAPLTLQGHVAAGRLGMQLTLVDGGLQTVAVSDPTGRVLQARQRLCVQTMSLDRL